MKRIAVIGGTGITGQCVVDYALQKGLSIRLMYRSEATVPERFKVDKVELMQGNVLNFKDCKKVIQGVDGVCIILGTGNKLDVTTELSFGTANLIEAMKEANIHPFSIVLSAFLFRSSADVPAKFHNIMVEHKLMLELTKQSGLDYIAILPPHITDEPSTKYTVTHDNVTGRLISKYDLAIFIVDSLEQKEHFGKVCGICKQLE